MAQLVVTEGASCGGDLKQLEEQEVLYKTKLAVRIVEEMPKDEFQRKFIKGKVITKNPVFGKLVSFGAAELSPSEKVTVQGELYKAGLPFDLTSRDEVLDAIAQAIAKRSVTVS